METAEAWLFDAYPEAEGMRVWLVERGGRRRAVLDPWRPALRVHGGRAALTRVLRLLASWLPLLCGALLLRLRCFLRFCLRLLSLALNSIF